VSINARFLEEARQLEKRWAKHRPNFINPDRKWERAATAVLLENQRLMNEQAAREGPPRPEQFKRLRIPLHGRRHRSPAYLSPAYNQPLTDWSKKKTPVEEKGNWLKEGF
jgi:hypothetical protein